VSGSRLYAKHPSAGKLSRSPFSSSTTTGSAELALLYGAVLVLEHLELVVRHMCRSLLTQLRKLQTCITAHGLQHCLQLRLIHGEGPS
jgi:hypothetical protein